MSRTPPPLTDAEDQPASRSETIALTLRQEILLGQYRPGERLPSERDLALRFQTGRGPVREALKRLEQLGIASVQHGGARAVAIEDCTLDVLEPLLELEPVPDPRLVDQLLEVFGVLVHLAAKAALRAADDAQLQEIKQRARELAREDNNELDRHLALREFTRYLIEVSDHLVLRLTMNGLVTSCLQRLFESVLPVDLDNDAYRKLANELCEAVDDRDYEHLGSAMQKLNRFFRNSVSAALEARYTVRKSSHA